MVRAVAGAVARKLKIAQQPQMVVSEIGGTLRDPFSKGILLSLGSVFGVPHFRRPSYGLWAQNPSVIRALGGMEKFRGAACSGCRLTV